jgi:SAM-dependent methyltransferase
LTSTGRPEDDWDRHWDEYSDVAEVNPAQRYRLQIAARLLDLGNRPARVVDIGSGQGDFAAELRENHPRAEVLGLEFSQSGIDVSNRKVPEATFLRRDLMEAGDPPDKFKVWGTHAVCSEVLEHVDSPGKVLANALPYLAPGCRLVVTVPGGPMSAFDKHIGHRKHFTRAELRQILEDCGLTVDLATGAGFPFFNLYRLTVILRGRRLIDEFRDGRSGKGSRLAFAVMRLFGLLFNLNNSSSRWGWQIVALARLPDSMSSNLN